MVNIYINTGNGLELIFRKEWIKGSTLNGSNNFQILPIPCVDASNRIGINMSSNEATIEFDVTIPIENVYPPSDNWEDKETSIAFWYRKVNVLSTASCVSNGKLVICDDSIYAGDCKSVCDVDDWLTKGGCMARWGGVVRRVNVSFQGGVSFITLKVEFQILKSL